MQHNEEVPESILQKIQKLKALADRPGTIGEAEAAMAAIQRLLLQYNLDMATVENYRPVEKEDVIYERHNLNEYQTRHDGDFAWKLISAIARFNFCRPIHHTMRRDEYGSFKPSKWAEPKLNDQGEFTIIGQRHNVEIVMYMYHYCLNNIKALADEGWKDYDRNETKIKTVYVRHFFDGACLAVSQRLYRQFKEQQQENETAVLVIVKYNDKAVDEKVNQLFPSLGTYRQKTQRDSGIKGEGYVAGSRMNLAAGLGGSNGNGNTKKLN